MLDGHGSSSAPLPSGTGEKTAAPVVKSAALRQRETRFERGAGAASGQFLQAVGQRLEAAVRCSDTVSRQGGHEFLVVLSEVQHAENAARHAEKIRATTSVDPSLPVSSRSCMGTCCSVRRPSQAESRPSAPAEGLRGRCLAGIAGACRSRSITSLGRAFADAALRCQC